MATAARRSPSRCPPRLATAVDRRERDGEPRRRRCYCSIVPLAMPCAISDAAAWASDVATSQSSLTASTSYLSLPTTSPIMTVQCGDCVVASQCVPVTVSVVGPRSLTTLYHDCPPSSSLRQLVFPPAHVSSVYMPSDPPGQVMSPVQVCSPACTLLGTWAAPFHS